MRQILISFLLMAVTLGTGQSTTSPLSALIVIPEFIEDSAIASPASAAVSTDSLSLSEMFPGFSDQMYSPGFFDQLQQYKGNRAEMGDPIEWPAMLYVGDTFTLGCKDVTLLSARVVSSPSKIQYYSPSLDQVVNSSEGKVIPIPAHSSLVILSIQSKQSSYFNVMGASRDTISAPQCTSEDYRFDTFASYPGIPLGYENNYANIRSNSEATLFAPVAHNMYYYLATDSIENGLAWWTVLFQGGIPSDVATGSSRHKPQYAIANWSLIPRPEN